MAWFPCCCSCVIFEDTFDRSDSDSLGSDWTEVSGDYDISSNTLAASTAGLVVCNTAHPDSSTSGHMSVIMRADSNGDKGRVVFNYKDSNNYHYLQLEWGVLSSSTNGRARIYKRSGGSDTQVGSDVTIGSLNAGNPQANIELCWYDNFISAHITRGSLYSFAVNSTFHADGYKIGFADGSAGVTWDTLVWSKHDAQQDGCEDCPATCSICSDTVVPTRFKIVLAGFTSDATWCTDLSIFIERCSSLNGTFIVPMGVGNGGGRCSPISGYCSGYLDTGVQSCMYIGDTNTWKLRIGLCSLGGFPASYGIDVYLDGPLGGAGSNYAIWVSTYSPDKPDCSSINNSALTYDSGSSTACNSEDWPTTPPTCHLTAL